MRFGFIVNDIKTEEGKFTTSRLGQAAVNRGHEVWVMGVGDVAYDPDDMIRARATSVPKPRYGSSESYTADLHVQGFGDKTLMRRIRGVFEEVRVFFRDTYDHCVQSSEVTEMFREMATGLMNVYLSSVANRTNEVMKVLTIVATIFIPLTFLAGIYGMNFEHMPELHSKWAYPMIWLAMVVLAATMLGFFWRMGWIGVGRAHASSDIPSGV